MVPTSDASQRATRSLSGRPPAPLSDRPAQSVTSMNGLPALVLASLALLAAVILQVVPHSSHLTTARRTPLDNYFPTEMYGWRGEDRPLSETEASDGAVKKVLGYDEALLRIYRKDGKEFSLYVAFWNPGKISSREVACHTPDICWPSVGWQRTAVDTDFKRSVGGRALAPAQYRVFETAGHREFVVYWHIVNGRATVYNPDGLPKPLSLLTDLKRYGLDQRGEQYFLRLSSTTPPDQLWNDEGVEEILELLAALGPGLEQTS